MYIHVAVHFRSGFSGGEIRWLRSLRRESSPERLSHSYQLAHFSLRRTAVNIHCKSVSGKPPPIFLSAALSQTYCLLPAYL